MGIADPPVRVDLKGPDGKITRPWREWLQSLTDAINKTNTITVVTQVTPETTEEITYVDGA